MRLAEVGGSIPKERSFEMVAALVGRRKVQRRANRRRIGVMMYMALPKRDQSSDSLSEISTKVRATFCVLPKCQIYSEAL